MSLQLDGILGDRDGVCFDVITTYTWLGKSLGTASGCSKLDPDERSWDARNCSVVVVTCG